MSSTDLLTSANRVLSGRNFSLSMVDITTSSVLSPGILSQMVDLVQYRRHSSSTVVASSSVLASFFPCVTLSRSRDGGVPSKGNGGPGPRARCCSPFGHRSRHKAGGLLEDGSVEAVCRRRRKTLPGIASRLISKADGSEGLGAVAAAPSRYASRTSRTSGAGTVGPRAARMGDDPWSAAGVMTPG